MKSRRIRSTVGHTPDVLPLLMYNLINKKKIGQICLVPQMHWSPRREFWYSVGVITARKRSLGQGNIFAPVCHSVHRGGCLPHCMLWYTPSRYTPLGRYTLWQVHPPPPAGTHPPVSTHTHQGMYTAPPERYTPRAGAPPGRYPPHRQKCMLGYGQQAGGTHPTGMQSCYLKDFRNSRGFRLSNFRKSLPQNVSKLKMFAYHVIDFACVHICLDGKYHIFINTRSCGGRFNM